MRRFGYGSDRQSLIGFLWRGLIVNFDPWESLFLDLLVEEAADNISLLELTILFLHF